MTGYHYHIFMWTLRRVFRLFKQFLSIRIDLQYTNLKKVILSTIGVLCVLWWLNKTDLTLTMENIWFNTSIFQSEKPTSYTLICTFNSKIINVFITFSVLRTTLFCTFVGTVCVKCRIFLFYFISKTKRCKLKTEIKFIIKRE